MPNLTDNALKCEGLDFQLGLYNQRNSIYPSNMEKSNVFGIAIASFKNSEPYAICTVNLPDYYGDYCEMIGIKNAAYMDTNNYPWVTGFIDLGIAVDTGFTKRSGFCEYPLYMFNEDWLKSLKTVDSSRTYDNYEKKYNEAMGIENKSMSIDEIRKKYPAGTLVMLKNMQGEDAVRMPSGLLGKVKLVDDIGQVHVNWSNGSSLALNLELDSFDVLDKPEIKKPAHTKKHEQER